MSLEMPKPGTPATLEQIKKWRSHQPDGGSLNGFFKAHNICARCNGRGDCLNWNQSKVETCPVCKGDRLFHGDGTGIAPSRVRPTDN